jgi:hypothetical protein
LCDFAGRGDVVAGTGGAGLSLGIVVGEDGESVPGEVGAVPEGGVAVGEPGDGCDPFVEGFCVWARA